MKSLKELFQNKFVAIVATVIFSLPAAYHMFGSDAVASQSTTAGLVLDRVEANGDKIYKQAEDGSLTAILGGKLYHFNPMLVVNTGADIQAMKTYYDIPGGEYGAPEEVVEEEVVEEEVVEEEETNELLSAILNTSFCLENGCTRNDVLTAASVIYRGAMVDMNDTARGISQILYVGNLAAEKMMEEYPETLKLEYTYYMTRRVRLETPFRYTVGIKTSDDEIEAIARILIKEANKLTK